MCVGVYMYSRKSKEDNKEGFHVGSLQHNTLRGGAFSAVVTRGHGRKESSRDLAVGELRVTSTSAVGTGSSGSSRRE